MEWIKEEKSDCILRIKVQPRASRTEVVEVQSGFLKIRLAAPPVDGEANACLIRFLKKLLHVTASKVDILSGEHSKLKRIRIQGVNLREVLDHFPDKIKFGID